MPEDNQQQQQPTVAELQAITVNTVKSIPHDLTYKEDSERLMMGVRRDILNDHLIVCKTLQQCVFKEKYAGEEFHQSMCVTNITVWFQCFFRRVHPDLSSKGS